MRYTIRVFALCRCRHLFSVRRRGPAARRQRLRRAIGDRWSASQSLILTALMNNAAEAADEAHLAVKLKGRPALI